MIDKLIGLDLMSVDTRNVSRRVFYKSVIVIVAHRNNYLFPWWPFHGHLDTRLRLLVTFDNVVYLINLLFIEGWERFLDLEHLRGASWLFQSLSIRFSWLLGFHHRLAALEIFWNGVEFILGFGWERRWRRSFLDRDRDRFGNFLVILVCVRCNSWSELRRNFHSESSRFIVSGKRVPLSLVDQWDEVPNGITHAIKVVEFISLTTVNLFIRNILCYEVQRIFDVFRIWGEVFDRSIKWNGVERTTSKVWLSRSLRVI